MNSKYSCYPESYVTITFETTVSKTEIKNLKYGIIQIKYQNK